MMQLTNTDKNALNGLTSTFRPLVEARLSEPFDVLSKSKQMSILLKAVTLLHSKTGDKGSTSSEILQFQANDFFNEVVGRFKKLTENEIFTACDNLYRGEYGQFFGLNAKTYNQLLKGYTDNPERSKAWLQYLEELDKPKTIEIPQSVKIDRTKQGLISRFEDYKKSGNIGFCAWMAYDLIKEFKGVNSLIDKIQFVSILKTIEPKYEDMVKKEKIRAERDGNLGIAEELTLILSNGIVNYKPCQQKLKESALKVYFDNIEKLEL